MEELELQQKAAGVAEGGGKHKQQSIEMVEQSSDFNEEIDRQISRGDMKHDAATTENNGGILAPESTESTVVETKEGEECMSSGEAASGSQIKEECNAQEETVSGV